ncbi:glycogen synthase GlgA [Acidaminococcus fermentans]|uniref:glycogen synthase GlgA n=1 Tax=Acidaminococcus fermentans TaxID=905 RepID=UPI000D0E4154|nr:glycogen synthase GlgA [Acidaminococcus fermentans]MDD7195976.1 glycogen synthase GlgA [Acidaminococcus fermentans]
MKVLLAASEAVPFIKTGGLADVMGALPAKLRREGVETALVIPKYSRVAERFGSQMETVWEGTVDLAWRRQYVGVEKIVLDGVPVFFIDNEYYFKRDGLYGFYDDGERFAYFCRALLAMLPHIGFRPDVIHSNDWHTGLVGVYLKENFQKDPFYQGMKSLFTIHNMKYQGIFSPEVVEDVLGLSRSLFDSGRIENNGCVNYLKAGMEYADAVNTVSPSYAEEIQYPYFGEGLDGYVRLCRGKITGILNGMDEKAYDPAEDPRIPYGYTDKDVFIRKPLDKEALQKELGLPVNRRIPVFAMISRLVEAKGLDLLTCIMDEMLQEDVQLVIVGTGDKAYEQALTALAARYPDKVSVNILFSEDLAHRVYAGADFFLMPSRYEACGLSQMISMKYGTIPVVHATGGLKDSVQDFQKFTGEGNGLSFAHFNAHELLFTIKRGLSDYEEDTVWEKLVLNAMHSDNSWDRSARAYKALYEKLAGRREEAPAPRLTLKEADMPLPEKPAGDGIRAKAAGTRKKTVRKTTERKKPVRKATVRKAVRKKPEFR